MSPHSKAQIAAVILAAGGSSRFGRPKQLIQFGGKTLVRRVVEAAREADCSPIIVVIGSDSQKIRRALKSANAVVVENKNWQRGIGSSIRVGVEALIKEVRPESRRFMAGVLLLVCDQPLVDANTIRGLITLREKTKKPIVALSYANTLGVPAVFDRSLFQELLSIDDAVGAKSIILQNRASVAEFRFPEGEIDIDSWRDYERLTNSA